MTSSKGKFVWYELSTFDPKTAAAFYGHVIGWTVKEDPEYSHFYAGPSMVAGMYAMGGEKREGPAKAGWVGYIGVADVDAFAGRVRENGGSVLRAPENIPEVGRFSVVADPHGAVFILFKGASSLDSGTAASGTPGRIGWHELYAGQWEEAFAFYSKLFGWTKAETMDMGAMGIYQVFAIDGVPLGGIMAKAPEMAAPFWLFYFDVEAIDPAIKRAEAKGGKLLMGPHQVPGGSWIAQCLDPEGAIFAMVAPTR